MDTGPATPCFPLLECVLTQPDEPALPAYLEVRVVYEQLDLEEDWEWIDTRGDSGVWVIDANGIAYDFKLNWLMGEPTEFYLRP